jgi:hypothetical protein
MAPNAPKLPILRYVAMIDAYLTAVFYLQFAGLTLYVGAQSAEPASNGPEMALQMLKRTSQALIKQRETMESHVPPAARYFTAHQKGFHFIGYAGSATAHALSGNKRTTRHNDNCVVYIDARRKNDRIQQWQFERSTTFAKDGTFALGKRARGTRDHPGGFLCWSRLPIWRIACWAGNDGDADHWHVIPVFGRNRKALEVHMWCDNGYLWHSHNGFEQADYGKKPFAWELSPV